MSNQLTIFNLTSKQIQYVLDHATYTELTSINILNGKTGMMSVDESPCTFINTQTTLKPSVKRTYVIESSHYYGNYFHAWEKFGRVNLSKVPAKKTSKDDLVISHLCGTEHCCTSSHMILEAKKINDERTHCHFAIWNLWNSSGVRAVLNAMAKGLCPHFPRCGGQVTINQSNKHIHF